MGSTATPVQQAPIAPDVPLPLLSRLKALREFHTGTGVIRDAGGPVAMVRFGLPSKILPPFAVITSPQGAHDVLTGSHGPFDKESLAYVESRALSVNLLNMPYQPWVPRRRMLQPLFTKHHVVDFAGNVSEVAAALTREWIRDELVDLDRQCRRLTLRVLGRSLFGIDLGDRAEDLGPPIQRCLRWITARCTRPIRSPAWLPTPARRRFRSSRATIRRLIDDAIQAARRDPDGNAELIQLLLRTVNPATGLPLTDEQICDELLVFLIAGHDTTATALTYALWVLGRDRKLQDRAASEVTAAGSEPLAADALSRLPLTTKVILEALRLCPPAPVLTRMTMQDCVIDGYRIPAGTNVMVGTYTLQRDGELWEQPEAFDPDRFLPERSGGRGRWQYLPFGGGPRTCIGEHFAMLEAPLALATIIRGAEVSDVEDTFPVALPFTMTADGPIPARVTARRS